MFLHMVGSVIDSVTGLLWFLRRWTYQDLISLSPSAVPQEEQYLWLLQISLLRRMGVLSFVMTFLCLIRRVRPTSCFAGCLKRLARTWHSYH